MLGWIRGLMTSCFTLCLKQFPSVPSSSSGTCLADCSVSEANDTCIQRLVLNSSSSWCSLLSCRLPDEFSLIRSGCCCHYFSCLWAPWWPLKYPAWSLLLLWVLTLWLICVPCCLYDLVLIQYVILMCYRSSFSLYQKTLKRDLCISLVFLCFSNASFF